jgi:hypothetical protein
MLIANPIYDVVFKYLMDDSKIAKLIISSIIAEEIEELVFKPIEFVGDIKQKAKKKTKQTKQTPEASSTLTVYRLDFSAKIKTPTGHKNVLIEIQKAKFPTDIMRFRKYLGGQYSNKENVQKQQTGGRLRRTGVPIVSIYFLGHKLDKITSGAIGINRNYRDLITNEPINEKEVFIESLTHDSYVIQIPYLTPRRRNDLEILLSVFDQSNVIDEHCHILNIKEEDYPEKYRPIIRKLQKAIEDAEVKQKMDMEDNILDELAEMERIIEDIEGEKDQAMHEKDQAMHEKDQAMHEKDQAMHEKDQAMHEKDQAMHEKDQAIHEKDQAMHEKDQAMHEKDQAMHEKDQALKQNEMLLSELAALRKLLEDQGKENK